MNRLGSRPRAVGSRAQRGSIWTGLVVVLALIAAVCVILMLVAGSKSGTARRGWIQTLGTPDEVYARFPAREVNAAALELERLAAEMGLDIVPRHAEERWRIKTRHRPHPPGGDADANRELKIWCEGVHGRVELATAPAPPAVVRAYLDERAGTLSEIRGVLLGDEPPLWKRRLESLHAAPIPNLLGMIELGRILVADALLQAQSGDEVRAVESLDAAWRLAESLAGEPEQIVNLIGMTITRHIAGALRTIEDVPLEWTDRLRSIEFREATIRAMQMESWIWSQVDGSDLDTRANVVVQALQVVAAPYWKMSMEDLSERLRVWIERVVRADPRCDADLEALGIGLDLRIPRWNIARTYYGPGVFGGVVERVNRLDLDLELTARLIELRAERAVNGGHWPPTLPGSAISQACPGDRWSYEVRDDGALHFGLDRVPTWRELPPSNRGVLPTSVVVP